MAHLFNPQLLNALQFLSFGLVLVGVAVWHRRALAIALGGLAAMLALVLLESGLSDGSHKLALHFSHEWIALTNLILLLLGFAVLANQFEHSNVPDVAPGLLPNGWAGGFALLSIVAGLSILLDNIAGAMIRRVIARHMYRGRVSVGFVAAMAAAANAGGAGSVLGDTTTTMMWLHGVSPSEVATAFVGAGVALVIFGVPAAFAQHRFQPITTAVVLARIKIDWARLAVVAFMLAAILLTNIIGNSLFPKMDATIPALGLALWVAIALTVCLRQPDWSVLRKALTGTTFLAALVASATLLPVSQLPSPSWLTALGLGFLSAVFDNIPLTALALRQGGYDWGLLAYGVGFGGSMIWFGSSAGVALTALYPEARSTSKWLRQGWAIPLAYVFGFLAMLALFGWDASYRP